MFKTFVKFNLFYILGILRGLLEIITYVPKVHVPPASKSGKSYSLLSFWIYKRSTFQDCDGDRRRVDLEITYADKGLEAVKSSADFSTLKVYVYSVKK